MFNMDEFLEKWASIYLPISHNPQGKGRDRRFYRIDAITSLAPFLTNLINAKSPSMAYVTQYDSSVCGSNNKFIMLEHRVFFLVKQAGSLLQNGATEELAAAAAKKEGFEMAQDLLAYLYQESKKPENKGLQGLDLSGASIFTTPQQFNGWWPTELIFQVMSSRYLCVNVEKYKK